MSKPNTDAPLELLPCPNPRCRSARVSFNSAVGNPMTPVHVYCCDCLLNGPREPTDDAGVCWNAFTRASLAPARQGEAVLTHDQARDIATEILDGTHCLRHGMAWEECCLGEGSLELAVKIIKALRAELTAATSSSPAADKGETI